MGVDFTATGATIGAMLFYGLLAIFLEGVRFSLFIFCATIGFVFIIEILATLLGRVLR